RKRPAHGARRANARHALRASRMEERAYEDAVAMAREQLATFAVVHRYNDARSMAILYLAEACRGTITLTKHDIDMLQGIALPPFQPPNHSIFHRSPTR